MRTLTIGMVVLCGAVMFGQTLKIRHTAPTDRALDLTDAELNEVARELGSRGVVTERVLEGGTYSVNVRRISGAETALVHGKITELWVVREGSGTVATGGTLVNAKQANGGAGEMSGTSIRGGVERVISRGDIVFIPPGVPHGIKEANSITYLNIRFETK